MKWTRTMAFAAVAVASPLVIASASAQPRPSPSPVSDTRRLMQEEAARALALTGGTGNPAAGLSEVTLRSEDTGPFIGARPADTDGDGLTADEERRLGTDADDPDTDGDALLDGWEAKGVNGIDLPGMGANPLHKDVFVEMDFMERATATRGLAPSPSVIARIVATLAAGPVTNPDGRTGIALHLELGEQVPFDEDLVPYTTEFAALKRNHFDNKRAPVFHYMIWANAYDGGSSSGISMDIPQSAFMVTLGRWNSGTGGTDEQKIGTFIHELGHNFGLKHGGSDHVNFKPNHLSVMNYRWQMRGLIVNGKAGQYAYQAFELPPLPEPALSEPAGLAGAANDLQSFSTEFTDSQNRQVLVAAAGAIDWNGNQQATDTQVLADLNSNGVATVLEGTPNEWAAIVYDGGTIGSTAPLSGLAFSDRLYRPMPPELTEELDAVFRNVP